MPDPPRPTFDGWDTPHFTPIPDQLLDEWLPHLSEAELKVLLYIMRRTFGFKKNADAISLSQMAEGIIRVDGTRLDWGAGVTKRSVQRALPALLEKGLIEAQKQTTAAGDPATTVYRLRLRGQGQNVPTQRLAGPTPGDNLSLLVGTQSPPQETGPINSAQEGSGVRFSTGEPPRYSAYIAAVVLDHATELGAVGRGPDGVSTALEAWAGSGLPEAAFVERLHAARAAVRKGQRPGVDKWGQYLAALRVDQPGGG